MGYAEELTQLANLHRDGVLTDEEFAEQKAKILAGSSGPQQPASPPPRAPVNQPMGEVFAGPKDRTTAGLLAIFLGGLGIHKFYLGYQNIGIIHLLVTIIGSFLIIGPLVMGVISLIEGITYLSKTDEDFQNTYVLNRKDWF